MPKSMTGYGRQQITNSGWNATWEIKSVNSRHLDLHFKTPAFLNSMLGKWEKILKKTALRGKVEIFLALRITDSKLQNIQLDTALATSMLNQLQQFLPNMREIDTSRLFNVPFLWKEGNLAPDSDLETELLKGLEQAVQNWDTERMREGEALSEDLQNRCKKMHQILLLLQNKCADLATDKFNSLQERIRELLDDRIVSEDRMLQELAILADKLDVSEELTRLGVHLQEINTLLKKPTDTGRKLDFLLQECFREITTCSNKSQSTKISHLAVDFKTELEKCREQVQNLE